LAFDTLYAEGQRRYIESLTSYARQFLGRLDRPQVERLSGLSPTIAIEQKSASSNPRSTVGTITEVYDYLRVLFARLGQQHCPDCGAQVQGQSAQEMVDRLYDEWPPGEVTILLAPLVQHRKGEFRDIFEDLSSRGYLRVRLDGQLCRLDDLPRLNRRRKHTLELVVDRVTINEENRIRLTEAVELALREGQGELVAWDGEERELSFSEARSCCGQSFPALSPQSFSFNSPLGMCPSCNGLGTRLEVDPDLLIPDPTLSLRQGAIAPWAQALGRDSSWTGRIFRAMADACDVDLDQPWDKLTAKQRRQVLFGLGERRIRVTWGEKGSDREGSWGMRFEGVVNTLMRRYHQTGSEGMREHYQQFMSNRPCDECQGQRLRAESLAVRFGGGSIAELGAMTVAAALEHVEQLELAERQQQIGEGIVREVTARLHFLMNVGLDYLTLDRAGPTLSGGEAQRIRLASQLGSELSGVMYVLDEPSIGLHQRDNRRLISTLQRLRDLGNTVIVVEHDEETIRSADHVVDFGPGAGQQGGQVVFSGSARALAKASQSLTGQYLSRRRSIPQRQQRREAQGWLTIKGARHHNLKDIDVSIPLGALVAISGVSGAGKSSLLSGIVLPALQRSLHHGTEPVGEHRGVEGLEALDKVIAIDQKPIGRTPRSNPGTYTKAFDKIRRIFAELPDARTRGYGPSRFSFNVKGGRCEACRGDGVVKVEMHFLADVFVRCDVCQGRRYNAQTLQIRYKGQSIADVLNQSITECLALFEHHPKLARVLRTLDRVGLGYVKLGQSAPTLSGGEAQRVKLSRELGKRQTGRTLYVLDEPTTGLHFEDIRNLLDVLQALTDQGNTVVVIEHNLEVIRSADWVIDLGPEGGEGGGRVVAAGTPEDVAEQRESATGQFLRPLLS
jgi:excinuclease ABC subunit A